MGRYVDELRRAIERYKHLLKGGEIDYNAALMVEEVEETLINNIKSRNEILEIIRRNDLRNAISILHERGILSELFEMTRKMTGESGDVDKALSAFLTGDIDVEGFKSMFLLIQSIARVKAEIVEEEVGIVESRTAVCPVCGAVSKTMTKEGQSYFMVCPFCGYKWLVSRGKLICPYCGNEDPLSLGIFTGKKAKRLGLVWCQNCDTTWHIVLDTSIRVPRLFLTIIAYGGEVYKATMPVRSSGTEIFGEPAEGGESTLLEGEEGDSKERE